MSNASAASRSFRSPVPPTPAATQQKLFISGNEALAQGAYEAGVKVACAYPGTPSTEIVEYLSQFAEIDAQWSVNEKAAFEVAHAAAIGGMRSLYASKHVGLNVAMDPFMTAVYTGVNAGFVVAVCDDPGMHSSQNEQDIRWAALYGKAPILEPSGAAEAYEYIKEAFEISERFDTPVIVRMTTRVAHAKENVTVGTRTEQATREFALDASKYVMVPRYALRRHAIVEERLRRLSAMAETSPLNRIEMGDRSMGVVTSGPIYYYVKELFPRASVLKLGFAYPWADRKIARFARKVKDLLVIEELDPFLEDHIRSLGIAVRGKHPSFRVGEIRPEHLPAIMAGKKKKENVSAAQGPALCRGCPHRFVFSMLRKLKAIVAGDIGCYTLGSAPPLSALHSCVCMGGGITYHEGFRRAMPGKKIVGVIGDSTFVHSGITGLINAAYNKCGGLIIILDNGTTAMTGGQNHPATGKTITDQPAPQLKLEELCRVCGADQVDVVSPYEYKKLEELSRARLSGSGLSVIIARAPCRLIDRTATAAPDDVRDQGKTYDLHRSIDFPGPGKVDDRYIEFDRETCEKCLSCVESCPANH